MVALVRVNDQGEPVPGADMAEGRRALAIAQTLCRSPRFQRFMSKEYGIDPGEGPTTDKLRELCGISSRSELAKNANARKVLFAIRDDFEYSVGRDR